MKKYTNYKNVNIEWLNEIPDHWKIKRLGWLTNLIVPMRDKPTSFSGDIPWIRIEDFDGMYVTESKSDQKVSHELVKKMNLKVLPVNTVVCTCSCSMGATAIVKKPLITNQTFIGIVPGKDLDSNYLFFLMQAVKGHLDSIATGAIQSYLSRHNFSKLKISLPSIDEQKRIGIYLISQLEKIDTLISKKQKLVDLLKEERAAIINQAVTKGVDPNAEMKNSGFEWLGKIPKHWKRKRLRYLSEVIDPQPDHRAPKIDDTNGYPYLGIRDINEDGTVNIETARKVEESAVQKQEKSFLVENGDIVFCKVGTLGFPRQIIKPNIRFALSATLVLIKVNNDNNPTFIKFALESNSIKNQIILMSSGSTRQSLGIQDIRKFLITIPEKKEQDRIVYSIETELYRINKIFKKIYRQIELLQEYRKALISEVVTGKIDVRDEVVS